jgi:hypothetical protein
MFYRTGINCYPSAYTNIKLIIRVVRLSQNETTYSCIFLTFLKAIVPPAVKNGLRNKSKYRNGTYFILLVGLSAEAFGAKITISNIQITIKARNIISLRDSVSPNIK